jgi:Fe-S cluster assembly protein SufD
LDVDVQAGGSFTRVVVQPAQTGLVLDGIRVRVGAGSTFRQFILSEGAKLARIETHVDVAGAGARVELSGVYLAGSGKHADLTSVINHRVADGVTRQLIKGAARKGGRGVFQGRIEVARGAQKTDARQHHHGLLLAEGAEIYAKPELEIYADDVQCAHGNTAGALDEAALFYMRSRGIPQELARAMLTEAFLIEAVPDYLPEAINGEVVSAIRAWLGGAP